MTSLNPYLQLIMKVVTDPEIRKRYPNFADKPFLEGVELYLKNNTGQSFQPILDIESVSEGLTRSDRNISLSSDWGVRLSNRFHPFIDKPVNITYVDKKFLVANSGSEETDLTPCAVLDSNLNFIGYVGVKGENPGQYLQASDINYLASKQKYFISAPLNDEVLIYNAKGTYEESLSVENPVAVGFGTLGIYVLSKEGVLDDTTSNGYLNVFNYTNVLIGSTIYAGEKNGTGRCFEGESLKPKDIFVVSGVGKDTVYLLNGNDEIGIFEITNVAPTGLSSKLIGVVNIPSELYGADLALQKITVADNIIYVTSGTLGQVIAIDIMTKKLIGVFGSLRNETTTDSPQTLGYFNGISGITTDGTNIYTSEVINNRLQAFGKQLLKDQLFSVVFSPYRIPDDRVLIKITCDMEADLISDIKIIDMNTSKEYSVAAAIDRKLNYISVKVLLRPDSFSQANKTFQVYPIYCLMERR